MDELEALVDDVAARLRARGDRMTGPRRAVLRALAAHRGHATADEVFVRVRQEDPSIHRASVYRTLDALVELDVVQHVHVGKGGTTYHLMGARGPHLHAQCSSCGAIVDLPADLLNGVSGYLTRTQGFHLDAGHVALAGLCADCATADGAAAHQHRTPEPRSHDGQDDHHPHPSPAS